MINFTKVNKLSCVTYLLVFLFVLFVTQGWAEPGLKITSPANGATIKGPDVTVTIELSDVTLVPPPKATKKEELHVIYALDFDTKPFLDGTAPKLGSGANRLHRGGTSVTFKDLAPGPHTVQVILVYSDHTPVKPLVAPSVNFVVDR
jgi:hypothetical protein